MRFAFFTAAAVVATIAHLTEAVKISEAEYSDYDNFSQIDALQGPLGKIEPPMTVSTKNEKFDFNGMKIGGDDKEGAQNLKTKLEQQFGPSCGCKEKGTGPSPDVAAAMAPQAPAGTPAGDAQEKMKRDKSKIEGEKKAADDDVEREKNKAKDVIKKQEDAAKGEKEKEDKKNEDKKKEAEEE